MVSVYIWINRLIDVLLGPFAGRPPLWPLSIGAAVMGVAAMAIYKYTSSQAGIKDAKEKIKGHFYEVWLYIDQAPVILAAQARIFYHAGRYLAFAAPPLVIMAVIFFPLFANFETRYAYMPLRPGQEVLVKLRLAGPFEGWQSAELLQLPTEVARVGYPVRFIRKTMASEKSVREKSRDYEVDYKLRPLTAGLHQLKFTVKGQAFQVPLLALGKYGERTSVSTSAQLGRALLYPPLIKIPKAAGVASVEIAYPKADFPVLGAKLWWVWPFLAVSMLAALAVKGVFKVEI